MSNFKNFVQGIYVLTDCDFDTLFSLFEPVHFKKKEIIFTSNASFKDIYFLSEGVFRCFVIKDGREVTTEIISEWTLYTDLLSIRKKVPSSINIQALDDCFCYKASFIELENLISQNINIKRLMFMFYEKLYIKGIQRQVSFIYDTQEERYRKFIASNEEIIHKIPFQYLASYLGIQPETLSRIRKIKEK